MYLYKALVKIHKIALCWTVLSNGRPLWSMSENWGDYLVTPPNLSGFSPTIQLSEYVDANVPPPQDYIIAQEQYTEIFPGPPPVPSSSQGHPQMCAPVGGQHGYGGQFVGQHNEIENRTLLVTNVSPDTPTEEIKQRFDVYGAVKNMDLSKLSEGMFTVEYYDIRHAQSVKSLNDRAKLYGRNISVVYAPLPKIEDPKRPPNNGTIVVFHLPEDITAQEIQTFFGRFGEIRQIRGTPAKPAQRFIEYWDIRAAEAALTNLSGKFLSGSKVSIEFSLPGGFRKNVQRGEQSGGPGQMRIHYG